MNKQQHRRRAPMNKVAVAVANKLTYGMLACLSGVTGKGGGSHITGFPNNQGSS